VDPEGNKVEPRIGHPCVQQPSAGQGPNTKVLRGHAQEANGQLQIWGGKRIEEAVGC